MSFSFGLVTSFPELFDVFSSKGLIGQAIQKHKIQFEIVNPREFTSDIHKTIDDRPYGGGDGMIMLAELLEKSVQKLKLVTPQARVVYLSPQGAKFTDQKAREFAVGPGLILVCGRYGGVDERFVALHVDEELSVGDYVLNGGEVGAMCVIEAVSRFLPGVLGNQNSAHRDSFVDGLLEAPQMTRPSEYADLRVPAVLTSGDHKAIQRWRRLISILRTYFRRPELLKIAGCEAELPEAMKLYSEMSANDRKSCGLPSKTNVLEVAD